MKNPLAMLIEVLKALIAHPLWTLMTLRDGVFRPKQIVTVKGELGRGENQFGMATFGRRKLIRQSSEELARLRDEGR
jgi:hypothetical protein